MTIIAILLAILFVGSLVYSGMMIVAAWLYGRDRATDAPPQAVGISVLKPLSGAEEGLAENLVSFFEQDYPAFELIFAVRHAEDPAVSIVQDLQRTYPHVRSHLIVTGEPPYANAKVYSLSQMTEAAAHEWLLMSDSDIRVERDFLRRLAIELNSGSYDLATCPYRAVPGRTIWSRLEALGMNSEFWGGVLVAKLVEGVKFTIGPTTVAHRKVLEAIPWSTLSGYLAEDFVLGQKAANLGFRVDLSHCIVEHRLPSESMAQNLSHRLRWARSTRRSRPAGYIGQIFTYPVALALLLIGLDHRLIWTVLIATAALRSLSVYAVERWVLRDSLCARYWFLIPIQDLLGFLVWLSGFTGNRIHWRGRRYLLKSDGTFEPVA